MSHTQFERRSAANPITHRSFSTCLFAALLFFAPHALAQELTEAEVIRIVRLRDERAASARAAIVVAEARETQAGLYPNPMLTWNREHLTTTQPDEIEDMVYVTLPVEVSGQRTLRRALSRAETASARSVAARTQSDSVVRALLSFYGILAANRQASALQRRVTRLDAAAQILKRRVEEGTASGYERERLEVEAELVKSELSEAELEGKVLEAELKTLLALDSDELKPKGTLDSADLLAQATSPAKIEQRPSLKYARASAAQAQEATRGLPTWIPALSVSGGLKTLNAGERQFGYIAQVAIDVPVFSRGQGLNQQARAEQRSAVLRTRQAEKEARVEFATAAREWRLAREELARFAKATRDSIERLERAAESSYREGRTPLYDLLEAQRARANVEERATELAFRVKRAELRLRAARGEFE